MLLSCSGIIPGSSCGGPILWLAVRGFYEAGVMGKLKELEMNLIGAGKHQE